MPPEWGLDFTLIVTCIGIVVPALRDRPALVSAVVAALVAVVAADLPYKLGLMAAAISGIVVGLALARRGTAEEREAGSGNW